MDPLSIIASTITIASVVRFGLEKIREHRGAALEIDLLINEVADLNLIFNELKSGIAQRDTSSSQDHGLSEKIAQLLLPAKAKLVELEKLTTEIRIGGRDGEAKLGRRQWQRQKDQLKNMLSGLKEVRTNLSVLWGALQLSVTPTSGLRRSGKLTINNRNDLSHIRLTLHDMSIVQANQTEQLSNHTELLAIVSNQITQVTVTDSNDSLKIEDDSTAKHDESQVICANHSQHPFPRYQLAKNYASDQCNKPTQYTAIRIRASQYRRHRCEGWCSCTCHKARGLKSPQLLESVLGRLFIGYSGFLSPTRPCSERQCHQQSIPTIKFNYYFPSWMLARAFQVTFLMSYMGGPELILRCPRVVPDNSPVLFQAVQGDVAKIQYLFDKGLASPYDVAFGNGRTALHVRT